MALTVHTSATIHGITYNQGNSFVCAYAGKGNGGSEGDAAGAAALTVGKTYYFLGYITADDSGSNVVYPYRIGSSSSTSSAIGYYKAEVFPYAKYTIKYNANGGTGAPSSQTKTYGTNLTLSSTKPTRTGYTFKGWALSQADANNGTWYYQAGGTCGKNENLTLYAVWDANSYTYNVIYKSSSGNQLGTSTVVHDFGTTNTVSPKSFTGYANPSSQSVKWDSTSAKTITFTYTPYKLTVNYRNNYADYCTYQGESVNVSSTSNNILVHTQEFLYDKSYSSALSNVQNPDYLYLSRTGYTPTGFWGTTTSGGKLVDEDADYSTGQALAQALEKDISSGNVTVDVYPQWQINTYTIEYDSNGGYGSMDVQSINWQETFVLLDNQFIREGYKFVGWNAYRNDDDTWYVNGQGWITEDEILANGYTKKLYDNQCELIFDNSWVNENEEARLYTMYAVWEISGVVYIDNGSTLEPYLTYIDNGSEWELYLAYVDNGIKWTIIS